MYLRRVHFSDWEQQNFILPPAPRRAWCAPNFPFVFSSLNFEHLNFSPVCSPSVGATVATRRFPLAGRFLAERI